MGLNATINLVANGLKLTQDASSLVSSNITNASTDGYTDKSLQTSTIYAASGIVGFKTTVTRAFDQEVFDQLVSSTASSSYLSTKSNYTSQIDTLLGSTESDAALPTALSSFSSDLQTLASQPSDSAAQIQVVNSATSLAQTINSLSSNISSLSTSVDGDINDAVSAVNDLTKQISTLNTQIVSYKTQGLDYTGLADQRDSAVLDLANYMDVQVKTQEDGSVRVSTTSALTLVDNAKAAQLSRGSDGSIVVQGTGSNSVFDLGMVSSGSLSALNEVKTKTLPQVQDQLDQVAAALASAMSDTVDTGTAVTSSGQKGFSVDTDGMQPGNKVTVAYTDSSTGASKTFTFVNVSSSSTTTVNDASTPNSNDTVVAIDFSAGSSTIASQIQSALGSSFSVSMSGTTLEVLDDGSTGTVDISSVTANKTATVAQTGTSSSVAASTGLPLFLDGTDLYTGSLEDGSQMSGLASRIKVNSAVSTDPSLLVGMTTTTDASDNTRPYAMLDGLQKSTTAFALKEGSLSTTQTLSNYASSMVSYWGSESTNASTDLSNQKVIQTNLTSSMSKISSVSTDTELAKLIQLQSVYSANAQVLSTLKEMLTTLMDAV